MADNFGVSAYAAILFVLTVWWSSEWGEATACPYTHLEDVIDGKADVRQAALKIWAQLTGGVLVFRSVSDGLGPRDGERVDSSGQQTYGGLWLR